MPITFQGYVNKRNIETWEKLQTYVDDNNCKLSECLFKGARLLLDYKFSPEVFQTMISSMNDKELDAFMNQVKEIFKREWTKR